MNDNKPPIIKAIPFVLRDAADIARREWMYGHHLIRKYVSLTIAPGGLGKTALLVADAIAMVTDIDLIGTKVYGGPKNVWFFNLEDPMDEMERRIAAACQRYGINRNRLGDRLFVDSGREQPLRIAECVNGKTRIIAPVAEQIVEEIMKNQIDVLIIDPFVSSHGVPENDNGAIDQVAKEWGRIAQSAYCAIELVHHLRKMGDQEATAESARGAVALVSAARSVRVLNRMTQKQAQAAGEESHRGFFSVIDDKNNLAPPAEKAEWFKLESVTLANDDKVGVVVKWRWPDLAGDIEDEKVLEVQKAVDGKGLRANVQAKDWVGYTVGKALGLDMTKDGDKARVKALIKAWTANGSFAITNTTDPKGQLRPIIEVGKWIVLPTPPPSEVG